MICLGLVAILFLRPAASQARQFRGASVNDRRLGARREPLRTNGWDTCRE